MRKSWVAIAATLTLAGVPTAAFAAKPVHPVHPTTPASNGAVTDATHPPATPTVMYVLRGTLMSYTPATTMTPGSVSITVTSSNFGQKTLKSAGPLTFTVSTTTTVVHGGKFTTGDRGVVKVRAPKKISTLTLVATLETKTAFEVIDQGPAKPPTG
ncbi:MAG TPA: hypothetical protein VG368_04195 [Acidimicrobiales bacterium]|nr:hypothetical protein [Acidimicrobiales bacterium]